MRIIPLGTSSGKPTLKRNVSALAIARVSVGPMGPLVPRPGDDLDKVLRSLPWPSLFVGFVLMQAVGGKGTWIRTCAAPLMGLPDLALLVGGDSIELNKDRALLNPYGVIPVNPARHPGVNAALAEQFAAWLVSPETQASIGAFGKDQFGQPLFFPGKAP